MNKINFSPGKLAFCSNRTSPPTQFRSDELTIQNLIVRENLNASCSVRNSRLVSNSSLPNDFFVAQNYPRISKFNYSGISFHTKNDRNLTLLRKFQLLIRQNYKGAALLSPSTLNESGQNKYRAFSPPKFNPLWPMVPQYS